MAPNVVLIDGDVLVYKTAAVLETATEFPDDMWVLWADAKEGREHVDASLRRILEMTGCGEFRICLTAPNNFRLSVDSTYKSNRSGVRRPMLLKHLREYVTDKHGAETKARLEGDDLIGIYATGENLEDHLIYSIDKDLRTVPGYHWDHSMEMIHYIGPEEAHKFFLTQVMAGDVTDGYPGAPKVGMITAERALTEMKAWVQNPENGKWKREPTDDLWRVVVSHFEKGGQTEEDAIKQAQLARILQHNDYDNGRIKLWGESLS